MDLILVDTEPPWQWQRRCFQMPPLHNVRFMFLEVSNIPPLLLECSTVKESVWDLAPRFKDMETLSRWTDQNMQTWRPYCATTACSVDPVHGDPQGAKGRHPPKQGDSVRLLCHSTTEMQVGGVITGMSGTRPQNDNSVHKLLRAGGPLKRGSQGIMCCLFARPSSLTRRNSSHQDWFYNPVWRVF